MSYSSEQERNAYKPIADNPIVLDFSKCRYPYDIHKVLKETFGFPEYYGENWDALWDCLRYYWANESDVTVEICGYTTLEQELRDYASEMFTVFDNVHTTTPTVTFRVVS